MRSTTCCDTRGSYIHNGTPGNADERLALGLLTRRSLVTMPRPVLLAVDDEPVALSALEGELRKRYGVDYEVVCAATPEAGSPWGWGTRGSRPRSVCAGQPLRYVGVRPRNRTPVDGPPSSAHSGRNSGGRTIRPSWGRARIRAHPRKPTCGCAAIPTFHQIHFQAHRRSRRHGASFVLAAVTGAGLTGRLTVRSGATSGAAAAHRGRPSQGEVAGRVVAGRLVAASWRLLGDPVPSSRDAGEPAAAGHQGLLGPGCCARIALDG